MADDTYPLAFKQGATFQRKFEWAIDEEPQSFENWILKSELRQKESSSSKLLVDLAEWMTVADDFLSVTLRVPGYVTAAISEKLFANAAWDFFVLSPTDDTHSILVVEGPVELNPASTNMKQVGP